MFLNYFQGYVTHVKDQGMCSSVAFSVIASVEAAHVEANGDLIALSEQQVIDCATGCSGGWFDTAWKYIIEEGGVNSEEDYPYESRDGPCRADSNSFVATVTGCHGGPSDICEDSGKDGSEANFVKALNDRPQSVTVDASGFAFYSGGIFDDSSSCSGSRLNHAVFAVGYGSEEGKDYYIIKNSWSKSWGEVGYIRLKRGTSTTGGMCGVALYPAWASANAANSFMQNPMVMIQAYILVYILYRLS